MVVKPSHKWLPIELELGLLWIVLLMGDFSRRTCVQVSRENRWAPPIVTHREPLFLQGLVESESWGPTFGLLARRPPTRRVPPTPSQAYEPSLLGLVYPCP